MKQEHPRQQLLQDVREAERLLAKARARLEEYDHLAEVTQGAPADPFRKCLYCETLVTHQCTHGRTGTLQPHCGGHQPKLCTHPFPKKN